MGRVKLKIKRLENTNGRQATYAKRKQGIIKKASELSILCDVDIVLLMFSPTGKPSLCRGKRSVEEVIGKFSQLTPQERTKRKLESLEALRKTFRKLDHDVIIPEFLGTSNSNIEELSNQVKFLRSKLSETQKRISCWTEPDRINSIEHLGQMENSLQESLNQIRMRKENMQKQHLMSLERNSAFNDIQMPFLCSGQQLQSFPWINNNDNPHTVLAEDPKVLLNRDVECSASSSYGSYASYIGTGKSPEISTSTQDNSLLNELNQIAPLRLQLGGQLPYLPYDLNLFNDMKIEPAADMSPLENPLNYHLAVSFEAAHRAGCSNNYHSWAPTSAHCPIPIFDDHLYAQIPD